LESVLTVVPEEKTHGSDIWHTNKSNHPDQADQHVIVWPCRLSNREDGGKDEGRVKNKARTSSG
jgi:hypothetical protein